MPYLDQSIATVWNTLSERNPCTGLKDFGMYGCTRELEDSVTTTQHRTNMYKKKEKKKKKKERNP